MSEPLAYLLVLAASIVPWFELFAIPPGIAFGLSPVGVGLVALLGNGLATIGVVVGWKHITAWRQRRRDRPPARESKRGARGRKAFERYGVPGLALQGPILSGIYLAAILALSLGAPRRQVLGWSLASVVVWTVGLVAATMAGLDVFGGRGELPGMAAVYDSSWTTQSTVAV